MDNELFEKTTLSSEHSIYSVKDFLNIFKSEVDNIQDDEKFDKINYIIINIRCANSSFNS